MLFRPEMTRSEGESFAEGDDFSLDCEKPSLEKAASRIAGGISGKISLKERCAKRGTRAMSNRGMNNNTERNLVGTPAANNGAKGHKQYPEVHPSGPVLQVISIISNPRGIIGI